jgi:hypothetical protein
LDEWLRQEFATGSDFQEMYDHRKREARGEL